MMVVSGVITQPRKVHKSKQMSPQILGNSHRNYRQKMHNSKTDVQEAYEENFTKIPQREIDTKTNFGNFSRIKPALPFHLPSRGGEGCPDEILLCSLNHQVRNSTFPFFSARASATLPLPPSIQPLLTIHHLLPLIILVVLHLHLLLPPCLAHQPFWSFPSPPPPPPRAILSTFSHLSHIHFPVRPPEDQPPASCMILALILQSPLCIVLIIDDRSSWRYVL